MSRANRPLGTDLTNPETRPWFFWDEDLSVGELRAILADEHHPRWRDAAVSIAFEIGRHAVLVCSPSPGSWRWAIFVVLQ